MSTKLSAAALKRKRNVRRKSRLSGGLKGAAYLGGFLSYHQCASISGLPPGANHLDRLLGSRVALDAKHERPPLSVLCCGVKSFVPGPGFDDSFHEHYPNERPIPNMMVDPVARKQRIQQIQRQVWSYYAP